MSRENHSEQSENIGYLDTENVDTIIGGPASGIRQPESSSQLLETPGSFENRKQSSEGVRENKTDYDLKIARERLRIKDGVFPLYEELTQLSLEADKNAYRETLNMAMNLLRGFSGDIANRLNDLYQNKLISSSVVNALYLDLKDLRNKLANLKKTDKDVLGKVDEEIFEGLKDFFGLGEKRFKNNFESQESSGQIDQVKQSDYQDAA